MNNKKSTLGLGPRKRDNPSLFYGRELPLPSQSDTRALESDLWSGIAAARSVPVQAEAAKLFAEKTDGDRDIFFRCEHCNMSLVVNRAATGICVSCERCGKLTAVPKTSAPFADYVARLQGIQRRLTENESQRTEATGYINQLNIQWHRWQVRLQTLNEHKQQLEKELALVKT